MSVQTQVRPRLGTEGDTENTGGRSSSIVPHPDGIRTVRVIVSVRIVVDDHLLGHDDDHLLGHDDDHLLGPDEVVAPDIRCRRCGHRLWAAKSLARGIGPECRRAERGEAA